MNVSKKYYDFVLIIFLFLFSLFLSQSLNLSEGSDDTWFMNILKDQSLLQYLQFRYQNWTGRLVLEALMTTTISYSLFWKSAVPGCIILFSYSIWRIVLSTNINHYIGIPLITTLFMLISPSVNDFSSWWITGFYNYLLPVSAGAYSMMIFTRGHEVNKTQKYISLLFLSICCSSEQVSFVFLPTVLIFSIYKSKLFVFDKIFIALTFIFTLILYTAPGNYKRYIDETHTWFPEFSEYNTIHKITLGIDRLSNHLYDKSNILFNIGVVIVLFLFINKKRNNFTFFFITLILSLKLLVYILSSRVSNLNLIYTSEFLSPKNWWNYHIYISYITTLLTIVAMNYAHFVVFQRKTHALFISFLLCIGAASVVIVGFSPTVYASGSRILFVFDICMIIYLCYLYKFSLKENSIDG